MTSSLVPSAVDPDVSASIQIYERLKPLKDALGAGDLTDAELQVFAIVAHHTGLDPFSGQIRAVKRKGKVTHQTGIDGYRATAERTQQYAGSDEATYEDCDCGKAPAGHPKIARVVVRRILANGHVVDQTGIARWHELYPEGEEGFMWRKMPYNQLAKCAEANGLRKAFPRVLGGVYISDEMQGAEMIDGQATEVAGTPPRATVEDRVAARRAIAEAARPEQEPAREDVEEAVVREDTPAPAAASANGLCGAVSPLDGATCGIAADVTHRVHKQIEAGEVVQTWPA